MFNFITYRYELFKLGNYQFILKACENNNVEKLEWLKNSGYEFKYDEYAVNWASNGGHVQVLEWFKYSGYEFKYNKGAIFNASNNGHVQVLEWFKRSGYKFKYNNMAIIYARNIIILRWFIENIHIKKVIKWSKHKNINILKLKTKNDTLKGIKKIEKIYV